MNKNKKINLLFSNLLIFALFLTCIIVPTANNSLSIKAVTTSSICSDPTASDYATKCINEKALIDSMKVIATPADTNYQTVWTRELSEFEWTDTSAMQNVDSWDGKNDVVPGTDTNGYYLIDTAEKLAYVINNLEDNDKIRLTQNIDLKGYEHPWNIGHGKKSDSLTINYSELVDGVEIDGGGFTIYNLGAIDNWFIRGLKHANIKDLNFVSAKMHYSELKANTFMGIFGALTSNAGVSKDVWIGMQVENVNQALNIDNATNLTNISVANSVFHSKGAKQQGINAYISPLGHQIGVHAKLIKTTDNSLYGEGAHVGGAFGRPDAVEVLNSYSLDSTIIANANHSGGFISCTNGALTVKDSFTNNEVYAKESTGVFIGAIVTDKVALNTSFENCYTSGTLEGTTDLGGFIGVVEGHIRDTVITFKNCYSTSIVGMENGGKKLGGFIGSMATSAGGSQTQYTFTNCYAAGEVGHISTNVNITDNNHTNNNTVGGFAGEMGTNLNTITGKITVSDVYYDKQTTGMREWQTGNSMDSAENLFDSSNGFKGHQNDGFRANIRGVLTSDSEKSGKGLASLPDDDKNRISGFVGFTNDVDWVYDGGNTDSNKHNCLYPQLAVFENPDITLWGSAETMNLVAASSLASVSTVHENVWEKGEKDQKLSTTVYDTVRELTTRFTMTSYVTSSLTDRNIEINWQKTNAKVDLYGESINVIGSLTNSYNAKYQRPYLTADKFAPGIEWMTVTVDVGGQKGTRKIRIIPTMNIDPGKDNLALNDGNNYNHAKDVKFAFSTGLRMSTNAKDITRALYPDKLDIDNLFNDDRDDFVLEYSGHLSSMNSFNNQDDKYIVNSKYITENSTASDLVYSDTETDYIHVRMFKVNNVTPINGQNSSQLGSSGKLDIDRTDNLLNDSNSPWIAKLNGTSKLETKDEGKYVVEYSCTLPDGRYLRDSKLLVVRKKNYDVSMQVLNYKDETYDTKNGTLNNNVFSLKADKYTNEADIIQGDYRTKTDNFRIADGVEKATPVYMAGKKLNADYDVKAIKLEVESFGGTQSQVFDSIKVSENTELEFLYDYYYGSYEVNGEYFVRIMQIPKKYSVVYNADNQIYYTVMNFKSNDSQYQDLIEAGVNIEDIDVDVKASIFVINNNPTTGSLKIIKETIDQGGQPLTTDEKFPFKISQSNTFQLGLLLSSATNNNTNIYTVSLPAGTYAFDEVVPMRYELSSFEVTNPDNIGNTDKKEFVIVGGKETTVKLTNKKLYDNGGTHYVTNTLKTAK